MRTIAIVSGKGGVGKTTTTINLGAHLNELGHNVLVIDGNMATPDISLSLGAPVVPVALQHVLSGKNKPEEAVYVHHSGTKVLPSSLSIQGNLDRLYSVTRKLRDSFDYILIDSAAGVGEDVEASIRAADECLIVTNPELPAVTGALKTIRLAERLKKPVLGVLVTRKNKNQLSLKNVKSMLDYPILGVIPEDDNVKAAQLERETLTAFPDSKAAKGYKKFAMKLSGVCEEEKGFFEMLKDFAGNFKVSVKFGK